VWCAAITMMALDSTAVADMAAVPASCYLPSFRRYLGEGIIYSRVGLSTCFGRSKEGMFSLCQSCV
jgi:hypothetical protein